jgi:large subunit ribosomal protein L13
MNKELIIDATSASLGRIASFAAKQALLGKSVIIVNCKDAIITGRKSFTVNDYQKTRARRSSSMKGPNFPKSPERILKRTIRGMLPYKKGKGAATFKKILCYNETPKEFEGKEKTSLQRQIKVKTISLSELSQKI